MLSPRKKKSILNSLKPNSKKSDGKKAKRKLDYNNNDQLNAGKSFILLFITFFKEYRKYGITLVYTDFLNFFRISRMSRVY